MDNFIPKLSILILPPFVSVSRFNAADTFSPGIVDVRRVLNVGQVR